MRVKFKFHLKSGRVITQVEEAEESVLDKFASNICTAMRTGENGLVTLPKPNNAGTAYIPYSAIEVFEVEEVKE